MKVKLTAKFHLDNGEVRKVDWIVTDPKVVGAVVQKGTDVDRVEIALKTAQEVQEEYAKYFKKLHKEEDVFIVPNNIMGEGSGIPFKKVSYWAIKAEEVTESEGIHA